MGLAGSAGLVGDLAGGICYLIPYYSIEKAPNREPFFV